MKNSKKMLIGLVAASALMILGSISAFARDITSVNLSFSGQQPFEGYSVGDISVKANGSNYFVKVAGYTNDESSWNKGDTPRVNVELYTEGEGNRFTSTSSSHFALNGMGASFRNAKIDSDGTHMQVTVTLSRVGGNEDMDVCDDLWWDGRTAKWDSIDGANNYEIQLMRDNHKVVSVKTSSRHYNFNSHMTHEGEYYFRVRGIDGSNKGGWSDWSDDYEVDQNRTNSNSTGEIHSNQPTSNSSMPGWHQTAKGWWFLNSNGTYPVNNWDLINNKWYFFNSQGYMVTGWVQWKGVYYYLGADGAMYANTYTPDGHFVNATGALADASTPTQAANPPAQQQTPLATTVTSQTAPVANAGGPGPGRG